MPQYELNFRDYWRIIRKRRFVIILTFCAVLISSAMYVQMQTPIYEAVATVKFEQKKTAISALLETIDWGFGQDPLDTEIKIINSYPVAEETAKRLGLITETTKEDEAGFIISDIQANIEAQKIEGTNLITISVKSADAERATDIVNTIAEAYVEETLRQKRREVTQLRQYLQEQLVTVEENLRNAENALMDFKQKEAVTGIALALASRLADLKSTLSDLLSKATEKHPDVIRLKEQIQATEEQMQGLPQAELEFARLSRDVKVNENLYTMIRQRFEEVKISEQEKISDATIVNPAIEPRMPIWPNKRLAVTMGAVVGVMLSLIVAFVTENLDTSISTIEDVESATGLKVLGPVPSVRSESEEVKFAKRPFSFLRQNKNKSAIDVALMVHREPQSPAAEAFRVIRTNLKLDSVHKSLLVTSSGPREGKTTILVGLGLSFAQLGKRTLIIDTDLRRPTLYKMFGIAREPGFNEVILGKVKLDDAVKKLTDILLGKMGFEEAVKTPGLDNLNIITCGKLPLNPAELLGLKEVDNLITEIKNRFDIVLFDSPPILSITDASVLAQKLDGVILVYEMGRTPRSALLRSKQQLESMGATALGVILNHINPQTEIDTGYYAYYNRYKYYYGKQKKETV